MECGLIVRDIYYLYVFVWFCYRFMSRSLSPLLLSSSSLATLTLVWTLATQTASHFHREAVTISKAIVEIENQWSSIGSRVPLSPFLDNGS